MKLNRKIILNEDGNEFSDVGLAVVIVILTITYRQHDEKR